MAVQSGEELHEDRDQFSASKADEVVIDSTPPVQEDRATALLSHNTTMASAILPKSYH